ncbi:MAG: bifunctional pyr operon transcriptional regulator/uracil phosphoribosyltransferase PyrR [Pseudomonadota bacterium]
MPNSAPDANQALAQLLELLAARFPDAGTLPQVVGIHTGGYWIAQRVAAHLGVTAAPGEIDIGFHRDDYTDRALTRAPRPTRLGTAVQGREILLVDDVLFTGRTIRAALNAIFEFGRPARVWLAVLADRGGRQLPIRADFAGVELDLAADQMLRLTGPEQLSFEVCPA